EVVVTVNPLANTGTNGTLTICPTNPITNLLAQLGGTPNSGGSWSGPSTLANGDQGSFNPTSNTAGTYTYTVTNSCGSSSNDVLVTITANPSPGTNGVALLCANATSINLFDSLNGTPDASGTWSGPSPLTNGNQGSFNPNSNANGTYTYTVNLCGGGTATAEVAVTVNALPTIIANSTNTVICSGDQITLTGSGANSYTWNNGAVDGASFTPATTTTYTVTGTNTNGCSNSDQILITVNSCSISPISNLSANNTSICINDCIDFSDISTGGIATSWSWHFFGATQPTSNAQHPINICYDSTGTFDVALMVENAFGNDSIFIANYITVDSCNTIPTSFIIPNVFSPNGDGQNDVFNVTGTGLISVKADIYNRWGSLMFNSEQLINKGWDGRTTAGSECTEGTYFYIISIETIKEVETFKGTITLIR
ncbi:MAG: gliding motility-associated C-terminal domain-containing protein, partial [Flavobacteriales bacterium]|nr:gliding motility-associated C-terminal domain-containing protein [Flavobacteriales bacterium]